MSFLTPLALLLSLLGIPIIILYMLRLRRREVRVSSVFLWQKLVRDREANAPWQKLKRNLLLLLQLLILALLVLALAQPYLPRPSVVNTSVVVLLDGSASMQATDVQPSGPNRFAAAQAQALTLVNELSGNNQMTLIQVGPTPQILAAATNDKRALREAINTAVVSAAPADWGAAFALASGAAQGFEDAQIIVISDGGVPANLPSLPGQVVYLPVGQSGANLAISALASRETERGAGQQLLARVTNHSQFTQETLLSLVLDGVLFDAQQVTVPAGESVSLTWDLPFDTAVAEVNLSPNSNDHLALDDTAVTVVNNSDQTRTLLITEGNLFLEQILAILPDVAAFKTAPDTDLNDPNWQQFDLYIFDGVSVPNPPPAADILLINPPVEQDVSFLTVTGTAVGVTQTVATRLTSSPVLEFVEWNDINIREMKQVSAPAWSQTQTLIEAPGGPLLLVGEQSGQRRAVLAFDLSLSDLPLRIAFPVLMSNLTAWLSPNQPFDAPEHLRPGDVVRLVPQPQATAVQITKPDGTIWESPLGEEDLLFTETDQLGYYAVSLRTESAGGNWQPAGALAVNLFSPEESRLEPRAQLVLGTESVDSGGAGEDNIGLFELWPYLAALALLVLLIEWWVYQQGTRLPSVPAQLHLSRRPFDEAWAWLRQRVGSR